MTVVNTLIVEVEQQRLVLSADNQRLELVTNEQTLVLGILVPTIIVPPLVGHDGYVLTEHPVGKMAWLPTAILPPLVGSSSVSLSLNAGDISSFDITVDGSIVGNPSRVGFSPSLPSGVFVSSGVSTDGVVTASILNLTGDTVAIDSVCTAFVDQ